MEDTTRGPRDADLSDVQNDFDLARSRGDETAEIIDEEPDLTTTPHTLAATGLADADVEPSLIDQDISNDPMSAAGPNNSGDDSVSDGDEVYVPPTDPVVAAGEHGEVEVLGGFSTTATDGVAPLPSASDNRLGDEAIEDAVRAALRRDAATTDLDVEVLVRNGVAHLRGRVSDLDDADNAEDVASRVPGVLEVVEELEVVEI